MLDSAASLWITDFGLAQFYAEETTSRKPTDRPGTLRYMSPEQAGGDALVLDQRTDIYSLGVTLYELLTLERAVPGDTREQLLNRLQNEDPRPARQVRLGRPERTRNDPDDGVREDPSDRLPHRRPARGRLAAVPHRPADPRAQSAADRAPRPLGASPPQRRRDGRRRHARAARRVHRQHRADRPRAGQDPRGVLQRARPRFRRRP